MHDATIGQFLTSFVHDDQLKLVAFLIAADFVLGVVAALKRNTFRLSYLSDFLRNDFLGKVVPWFFLFSFGKAANAYEIVGPVGFGALSDAAFIAVTAALAGSILKSVSDFGIDMPEQIAGTDPAAPGDTDTPAVP